MKKKLVLGVIPIVGLISIIAPISCGAHSTEHSSKNVQSSITSNQFEKNVFTTPVDRPQTIAALKKLVPGYYDSLKEDANGQELFDELHGIQTKYYSGVGSYSKLWTIYPQAFADNYDDKDGSVLDIYEEIPGQKDVHTLTFNQKDNGRNNIDLDFPSSKEEGQAYNREHIVPEAVFDAKGAQGYNQDIPSHNDAHFIYPTDRQGNAAHLNFVYDWVNQYTWKTTNGSAVGFNTETGHKFAAFEPINSFKGDVARATLYFALTWRTSQYDIGHGSIQSLTSNKSWPVVTTRYQDVYKEWSKLDPVGQWDVDRNNTISQIEGGLRNPFTDMPKLAELIWQ